MLFRCCAERRILATNNKVLEFCHEVHFQVSASHDKISGHMEGVGSERSTIPEQHPVLTFG